MKSIDIKQEHSIKLVYKDNPRGHTEALLKYRWSLSKSRIVPYIDMVFIEKFSVYRVGLYKQVFLRERLALQTNFLYIDLYIQVFPV